MSTVPANIPPTRHALGLPAGSIRAILALGVLAYLWILAVQPPGPDADPELRAHASVTFVYMQVLMVLILAHFFTAHGRSIGRHVSKSSPLSLPRGSVRLILLAGYAGLTYYMYLHRPSFDVPKASPLALMLAVLIACFLVGHGTNNFVVWMARGRTPAWFQDVQAWFALIGLIVLGIIVIVKLVINPTMTTPVNIEGLESVLAGIVGFYFGARS